MKKVLSWILAGAAVFGLGTTAALKTVDAYDDGEYQGPTVNAYGEVVDAEGNPVPGATVALIMNNEFEYAEGQTDENGMVVIPIEDPREQIGYGSMTQPSPLAAQLLSPEEIMSIVNEYKETQTLPELPAGKMGFYANPSISFVYIDEYYQACYIEIEDGQRGIVAFINYNWSGSPSLDFTNYGLSAYLDENDPTTYADDRHYFAFDGNEGSTNGSWMVEVDPYNVFLVTDMSLKVTSVPTGYDLPSETIALKPTPAVYYKERQYDTSAFSDMVESMLSANISAMYAKGSFIARKTAGPVETPSAPTAPKAQSCQDVGYPEDYSWNEELKACVPFAKRIPVVNTSAQ